jgi:hypothetical protein
MKTEESMDGEVKIFFDFIGNQDKVAKCIDDNPSLVNMLDTAEKSHFNLIVFKCRTIDAKSGNICY